ncbi:MAG: heme-binding protein [Pseudomonadota bacterium]
MIVSKPSIAADTAHTLAADCVALAKADGLAIAVAVTDPQGAPLALLRMEDVSPPVADFAIDKAYTAATMGKSTEAFADRMSSSPALSLGLSTRPRLIAWGGGVPILKDGIVVGGVGVSGALDHQDIACATAAIEKAGFEAG